jgi:hypothetical protein
MSIASISSCVRHDTERPKSIALMRASGASLASMKLPGLMSRCRMPCAWHCAIVRSTARMIDATCTDAAVVYDTRAATVRTCNTTLLMFP